MKRRISQFFACRKGAIAAVLCLIALFGLPFTSHGQVSVIPTPKTTSEPSPVLTESTQDAIARLQQALAGARQSLTSSSETFQVTPPEQVGATADEIQQKLRLLNLSVLLYGQLIETLSRLNETRQSGRNLATRIASWQGFKTAPPYPLNLVDELRDALYAEKLALERDDIRKKLIQQERDESIEALKKSEQQLRLLKEGMEKPVQGQDKLRQSWRYGFAELEKDVSELKMQAAQAELQALEESLAFHRKKAAFIQRQKEIAAADFTFNKVELDQKLAAIDEKQRNIAKQELQSIAENNRNHEQLQLIRQDIQKARGSLGQSTEQDQRLLKDIKRLEEKAEVRKAWADTSTKIVELFTLLNYSLNAEKRFWEERFQLAGSRGEKKLKDAAGFIANRLEKFIKYRSLAESSLILAQNLALIERQRLASETLTEREQSVSREKLKAYQKRADFLVKTLASFDEQFRLGQRFQEEIEDLRQQATLAERLYGFVQNFMTVVRSVWYFELFSADDTILVDGRPVTQARPVTISKVIRALLIFVIGIWLAIVLNGRIRDTLAQLFKMELGDAATITNLLLTIVVVCLFALAMTIVKIPLTIFAFLGGALAIAVGFGAQALINNFISGIILLFERPIRVGDRVDIEGTAGWITGIGLRATQIRCYDGIDILVPNSEFLQKKVVNWTLTDQLLRRVIKVGVAYGSPTREVAKIITHALDAHGKILADPAPVILFEDFGDSALIFSAYFWVEMKYDVRQVDSDLRHMLDKRLREAGITIAFPQLDVHIDQENPVPLRMVRKPQEKTADETKPQGEPGG